MTIRTTSKTVTFSRSFFLKGVGRLLPPGDYRVVTDEELGDHRAFGPSGGAGTRWAVSTYTQVDRQFHIAPRRPVPIPVPNE